MLMLKRIQNPLSFNEKEYLLFKDIINDLVSKVGFFNEDYIFAGVEYTNETFPYITLISKTEHVHIMLTKESATDEYNYLFELSHECVHLISPSNEIKGTYLEEGLATYNSLKWMKKKFDFDANDWITGEYKKALNGILEIEKDNNQDIFEIIGKIRKKQPYLDRLNEDDFLSIGINYEKSNLYFLLSKFKYREKSNEKND